jgi:hypothetical protein
MPAITPSKLPKAEHATAEWQAAMEALILGWADDVRAYWDDAGAPPKGRESI